VGSTPSVVFSRKLLSPFPTSSSHRLRLTPSLGRVPRDEKGGRERGSLPSQSLLNPLIVRRDAPPRTLLAPPRACPLVRPNGQKKKWTTLYLKRMLPVVVLPHLSGPSASDLAPPAGTQRSVRLTHQSNLSADPEKATGPPSKRGCLRNRIADSRDLAKATHAFPVVKGGYRFAPRLLPLGIEPH